jgi:hypothetical protein
MAPSDAFGKAIAERNAKEIQRRLEAGKGNRELESLFIELQAMRNDLSSYFVTFGWGKSKFHPDEKCIVIETEKGKVWQGSNAIEFKHGLFIARGGHGTNKWNETTHDYEATYLDADLGKDAKEAASTIARVLVANGHLPALGRHTEVGWHISDASIRKAKRDRTITLLVWAAIIVGFFILTHFLSRM